MSLSLGIVGLPNVGKSTLFNALTKGKQANVANYPFCTIDPNVGVVEVPDDRLRQLAAVSTSAKTIPAAIQFVDIAGLVKGAAEGAGLGNKFLSHIRETDAILQVVRAFTDKDITHVQDRVDPNDDANIINTELALADLETVKKRLDAVERNMKSGVKKEAEAQAALFRRVFAQLSEGTPARRLPFTDEERVWMKELQLLTMKPMLYVVNTDENHEKPGSMNQAFDEPAIFVRAKLEAELAELSPEDAAAYMKEIGMTETGLDALIRASYELLNLITYFTSGEPETRAWTVARGAKAPEAGGVIHTDFIKGFIKADVVHWQDFVACGGWARARDTGKLRLEGKEYVVKDGDVCFFHVSA